MLVKALDYILTILHDNTSDLLDDTDRWGRRSFRKLIGPGKKVDKVLGDRCVAIRVLMEFTDSHKTPLEPGQIPFSVGHFLHRNTPLLFLR